MNKYKISLLLSLVFWCTSINSQIIRDSVLGDWYSCKKRNFEIGDTIALNRNECRVAYEHNGIRWEELVVFRFDSSYFSLIKSASIISSSRFNKYWDVEGSKLLIGNDSINQQYEIISLKKSELKIHKIE